MVTKLAGWSGTPLVASFSGGASAASVSVDPKIRPFAPLSRLPPRAICDLPAFGNTATGPYCQRLVIFPCHPWRLICIAGSGAHCARWTNRMTNNGDVGVSARPRNGRFGPPLRTLIGADFHDACCDLLQLVESDFSPTLLVGIKSGGLVVA